MPDAHGHRFTRAGGAYKVWRVYADDREKMIGTVHSELRPGRYAGTTTEIWIALRPNGAEAGTSRGRADAARLLDRRP